MPYLDCPECHATFQTGVLYPEHDSCPRCGTPFDASKRRHRRRHRAAEEPPDWETITRSQYTRPEYVSRPENSEHETGSGHAA